jgi:hypothetical protein
VDAARTGDKLAYALCYPSQIAPEVAREIERYAELHSGREHFVGAPEAMRKLLAALAGQETAA